MCLTQTVEFFSKDEASERHFPAELRNEGNCPFVEKITLTCYHNQTKAMQTNQ